LVTVRAHHFAVGFEIAQLAAREFEGGGRHINDGRVTATSDVLTIATMALEHLDLGRRGRAFVAYRTADASARKWSFDHKRSEGCERGVLPRRPSYSTNDPISTGQRNVWWVPAQPVNTLCPHPAQFQFQPRLISLKGG